MSLRIPSQILQQDGLGLGTNEDNSLATVMLLFTLTAIMLAVFVPQLLRRGERGSAVEDFALEIVATIVINGHRKPFQAPCADETELWMDPQSDWNHWEALWVTGERAHIFVHDEG